MNQRLNVLVGERGFEPPKREWLSLVEQLVRDFVAETLDGRLLVVEYKGKDYASNDDSKEKKILGEVWAKGSGGRALFLMAVKKDERGRNVHEQIWGTIEGW
jgi:type III restriction enzyme